MSVGPFWPRALERCVLGGLDEDIPHCVPSAGALVQRCWPVALPSGARSLQSCPGQRHLPETPGDPKWFSPRAPQREACWGRQLRLRRHPGTACWRLVGAALSQRTGAACLAWRGHAGSSRRRISGRREGSSHNPAVVLQSDPTARTPHPHLGHSCPKTPGLPRPPFSTLF